MSYLPHASAIALCVLTIASDLYAHRVRNVWLLAALLLGAVGVIWTWLGGTGPTPWTALAGLVIGLLALLPFHVLGWMGAGDVKLFAVLGFLLGGKALLPIWIVASLFGGAHALCMLLMRRTGAGMQRLRMKMAGTRAWQYVLAARQGRKGLPFAAYMAMGALLTVAAPQLTRW
ncbi:A24 family peptidase [Dyella agri]|uniref:Prepilin peptidase n=1 Tax=Dyella agri TaxID=1926869 RepID=A0ABW8KMH7_9GAMM